jgi:hypothetical protein
MQWITDNCRSDTHTPLVLAVSVPFGIRFIYDMAQWPEDESCFCIC